MSGLWLLLAGCGSTLTLLGAAPLAPRQTEIGVALSGGADFQPAVTGLGVSKAPWVDLTLRHGLRPDTDLGVRVGMGGLGVDLRHRWLRAGPVHLAVDGAVLVSPQGFAGYGHVDLRGVGLAEFDLAPAVSMAFAPGLMVRTSFGYAPASEGVWLRPDLVGTLHGRLELRPTGRRSGVAFVIGAELIHQPLRPAPLGWQVGGQLLWRTAPWTVGLRRSLRPTKGEP